MLDSIARIVHPIEKKHKVTETSGHIDVHFAQTPSTVQILGENKEYKIK